MLLDGSAMALVESFFLGFSPLVLLLLFKVIENP